MANPTRYDITITIGDDFTDFETMTRKLDGQVVNVSGYSYVMTVRRFADSQTVLTSTSLAIISGAAGTFGGTIADTVTDTLPAGPALYTLKETTSTGVETTLLRGVADIVRLASP